MKRRLILAIVLVVSVLTCMRAWADTTPAPQEEVVTLPVTLKALWGGQQTRDMYITIFRPKGQGPFPLAVINHGRATSPEKRAVPKFARSESAARYFVRKGFVVLVPTRVGYGATGQDFDPEDSGTGNHRNYRLTLEAASTQVLAAIEYGRGLPDVDAKRIVLIGQSVGGFTTVATAAKNPPGLVAAINFAGGAGGDPDQHPGIPASAGQLKDLYAEMGQQVHVPMLWIYTENDRFFGPEYTKAWAKAFTDAGGQADYRLLPAFEDNGHLLFEHGCDIWMPLVEDFLKRFGFQEPGLIPRPQATTFAAIEDIGKVPYISASGRDGYRKFLQATPPRAFAITSDGHWGYAYGDDALARALANCQRGNGAANGRLYAVDANVVW